MPFPTASVLEQFTAANGTLVSSLSGWAILAGANGSARTTSNQASTVGAEGAYVGNYRTASHGPDCEVYLTVAGVPTYLGLGLRIDNGGSSSQDGYWLSWSGSALTFQRSDNGVDTQLGATVTRTCAAGEGVGLEAIGSALKIYTNTGSGWVERASRTDSTYASGGQLAFDMYDPANVGRLDDFGGGTVSAGTSHETRDWQSSYVVNDHQTPTWQSSYTVRARQQTTWQSSYTARARVTTSWSSGYVTHDHQTPTWSSSYLVHAHVSTTWASSYTTRARVTTTWSTSYDVETPGISHEQVTWQSSWTTNAHVTSSWATSYVVRDRDTRAWPSSYAVRIRLLATWPSGYTVAHRGSVTWVSSYTTRARVSTSWGSRYSVGGVLAVVGIIEQSASLAASTDAAAGSTGIESASSLIGVD